MGSKCVSQPRAICSRCLMKPFPGTGGLDSFSVLSPSSGLKNQPAKPAQMPNLSPPATGFDDPFGGSAANFSAVPPPAAGGHSQQHSPGGFDPFTSPQPGFEGGNAPFLGAFGAASSAPNAVPILPGSNAVPQRGSVVLICPVCINSPALPPNIVPPILWNPSSTWGRHVAGLHH